MITGEVLEVNLDFPMEIETLSGNAYEITKKTKQFPLDLPWKIGSASG